MSRAQEVLRLVRYGAAGHERPGLVAADGTILDLSSVVRDIAPDTLPTITTTVREALRAAQLPRVAGPVRLGPCVGGIGKIVCIGLNYLDHARETGAEIPAEPVVFLKATTAVCGPDDDLLCPPGAEKLDWEVELAVVIGSTARHVAEADAMQHVAGCCILHDVSERAFQLERGGQWDKGKGYDTFGPLGPWLVLLPGIPNVQALRMTLDVNGRREQDGTTADMIFQVPYLVSYVSRFMTLLPGDIISTGTPAGVGLGRQPPRYLRVGDRVELAIEGLGVQRQRVVAEPTA